MPSNGATIMRVSPHILRLIAVLAVCLQVALPLAQARAAQSGVPLAALICNPSGQPPSATSEAAISDLLSALGQSETPDPMPDCERCVVPGFAVLLPPIVSVSGPEFARAAHQHPISTRVMVHPSRGPPCGTRAPTLFV